LRYIIDGKSAMTTWFMFICRIW